MSTRTFALRAAVVAITALVLAVTAITAWNYSKGAECFHDAPRVGLYGGGPHSHDRSILRLGACAHD